MADLISTPDADTVPPGPPRGAYSMAEEARLDAPPELTALRKFVEGSASAFAVVTERYAGLVYSAALRRTGSREMAEEATQNVFMVMARKAPALLRQSVPLASWLHRAAVLEASQARRREQTRQRVMKTYMSNQETNPSAPPPDTAVPETLLPELDEGLNRLPGSDRELLLARYFENRSYRELSVATGRSEAALMQQHHRALEKLSRFFQRRGHAVAATALATGLSAPLSSSAPAGVAAGCATAATTAAAAASGIGAFSTFQLALTMQIKTHLLSSAAALLLLAGTAAFLTGRWQRDRVMRGSTATTSSGSGQKFDVSGDRSSSTAASVAPSGILADLPIPGAEEVLAAEGRERLEKLALWLTTAQPDAMADMLEKLAARDETDTQRTEKELILQRWVEEDQKGAFAANRKIEGNVWMACEAWGRARPREAWAGSGKLDSYEKSNILSGIIATDPQLAEEIIAASVGLDGISGKAMQGNLASSLTRKDPRLGWEYAIKTGAWMKDQGSLDQWIKENPDEAVAFARSRPVAHEQCRAMEMLIDKLGTEHPGIVDSLLDSLPEGRLKWKLSSQRAWWLARGDFDTAIAFTRNPSASLITRAAITESLAERWADSRPESVLSLLRGLDWNLSGEEISRPEILTPDTPAAGTAVGESKAAEALKKLAGNGHLAEALEVAGSVPAGFRRDQALGAVVEGWPAAQVMELSQWLSNQDSPAVRETGARHIVYTLLRDSAPDFESAATWAATLPLKGPPEQSYLFEVMSKWREKDSAAAAAGMQTLSMPDSLRSALEKPAKP